MCVAAVAAWNVGWAARHEKERDDTLADLRDATDPSGGPIHADPAEHADGLSLLAHDHLAPAEIRARAIGAEAIPLATLPIGGYDARLALRRLPPLIKAYLSVGAELGDGAYIDRAFNTIDVFVMMPVARISARYAQRFEVAA